MKVQNFSKICFKFFEKYSFENIASFSCRGCQTLSPDMRRTYTFLKSPRHTDFKLCGCLNKHRPSAKQYVSTVNCET